MYLTLDLGIFAAVVLWFIIGLQVFKSVPMIRDRMVSIHRYHPRLVPILSLILILGWPFTKVVWYIVERVVLNKKDKR